MAKYQVIGAGSPYNGVKDTETGAFIPNATGNRHWREYLVWVDEGNTPDPDPAYLPPSNEELKAQKLTDINSWREVALNSTIIYDGNVYDSDQRSRDNLTGIVAYIANGGSLPSPFIWRTADNQSVQMDATAVSNFGAAMVDHVNTQYSISWVLKAQVEAVDIGAPDYVDQMDAIVWPGSPTIE